MKMTAKEQCEFWIKQSEDPDHYFPQEMINLSRALLVAIEHIEIGSFDITKTLKEIEKVMKE